MYQSKNWLVLGNQLHNTAKSISDLSTLRYCGAQRLNDIMHEVLILNACTVCNAGMTEFIATVTRMHIGQCAVRSTTMQNQNGDNYLKDGHLMPPERPRRNSQLATGHCCAIQHLHLQHKLQFQWFIRQMPTLGHVHPECKSDKDVVT